jgi:nicotinamide riboside kinase
MRKIVITGPESSGKTTLSVALSTYLTLPLVPEYARQYLEDRGGAYDRSDLLMIAQGQATLERRAVSLGADAIICDTDLLTIVIWSDEKYGCCDTLIRDMYERDKPDLYLLCKPDIPWEPDPLRENPSDRDRLMDLYSAALRGKDVEIIHGDMEFRMHAALEILLDRFPELKKEE